MEFPSPFQTKEELDTFLEKFPPEIIEQMCENMFLEDLSRFSRTSKVIQETCSRVFERKQREYLQRKQEEQTQSEYIARMFPGGFLENLDDEGIYFLCQSMSTPDLHNFMQAYDRAASICDNILYQRTYG